MPDSQNAPEILPELSQSATRLKRDKLERGRNDTTGNDPGKRGGQSGRDGMWERGSQASFRNWEADTRPEANGGAMCVATNVT